MTVCDSGFALIPAQVLATGNGYAIAVYAAIAQHADREGIAFPSLKRLCEITGWSRPTVDKAIAMLVSCGVLVKERRFKDGVNQSNQYRLPLHLRKSANVQIETSLPTSEATLPTLETSLPLVGNDVSSGTQPRFHEQEPIEQDSEEQEGITPPSPSKRKRGELTEAQQDRFDRWYAVYPKKRSKLDAVKAWQKIDPDDALVDRMVAKVAEWADSHEWTKDNGQFVPNPATWLNRGQWEDGSPAPRPQAGATLTFLPGGRDPGQPRLYDHRGNPTPEYWAIKAREEEAKEQQAAGGM